MVGIALRAHQPALLVVLIFDPGALAAGVRYVLAHQPVAVVIQAAGVDDAARRGRVAPRDLQQALAIPGEIELRRFGIAQLPGVDHAALVIVIELEEVNRVPGERMKVAIAREPDRGPLSRGLLRDTRIDPRAVPQREIS